ncbi:NAD dependent epimerase [Colletotrichum sojae]|uniref:NAD dependent epimerase n=1 Tax=Colletotrichum sojae TaxID=2175907 RepID=A0A8H6MVA1_9PEZI|nr:NAD dependent epimerase [Colletotrichum sojae]
MGDSIETADPRHRSVLVVGANGYLGLAICRACLRAAAPTAHEDRQRCRPLPLSRLLLVLELIIGLGDASSRFVVPDSLSRRRPFVLWSSGCKDYGTTGLHGDPNLQPHTKTSPLNAPLPSADGRTPRGSYFGAAFEYASRAALAAAKDKHESGLNTLDFAADAGTILHSLHVDDCAEAEGRHAGFHAIAGKIFNVSGRQYETLKEVGDALAAEYGFTGGARLGLGPEEIPADDMTGLLVFGRSQWVDSDKIRKVTGWADRRLLFSENVGAYRLAYEAAKTQGSDNVGSISRRMAGDWGERK